MGTRLPILAGLCGALAAGAWSWYALGPWLKLAVAIGVVGAAAGYFGARRLLRGAPLQVHEWTLGRIAGAADLTVGDLIERIEQSGYRLDAHLVDEVGERGAVADRAAPLPGAAVALADRRLAPARGHAIVRVAHDGSFGLVEAADGPGGAYEELATFTIVALAALAPGLTAKRSESKMAPDDALELGAVLPRRPRGLEVGGSA